MNIEEEINKIAEIIDPSQFCKNTDDNYEIVRSIIGQLSQTALSLTELIKAGENIIKQCEEANYTPKELTTLVAVANNLELRDSIVKYHKDK